MAAGAADPRFTVDSEHLDDADEHTELIAFADCFLSLQRSEGLGRQMAAGMWLGTPAVATGYAGNLDLMDDWSAALVDARLAPVGDGRDEYPNDSLWADPDLAIAANWMHRFVCDGAPDLRHVPASVWNSNRPNFNSVSCARNLAAQ